MFKTNNIVFENMCDNKKAIPTTFLCLGMNNYNNIWKISWTYGVFNLDKNIYGQIYF